MSGSKPIRRALTWDEDVLAEHDKERGTRQKITEPPTPYAYGSDVEDEEEGTGRSSSEASTSQLPPRLKDRMNELNAKLAYQQHLQKEALPDSLDVKSSDSDEGRESGDRSKRDFTKKRANHYSEFKVAQALRSRGQLDDDEDDEGEGRTMET